MSVLAASRISVVAATGAVPNLTAQAVSVNRRTNLVLLLNAADSAWPAAMATFCVVIEGSCSVLLVESELAEYAISLYSVMHKLAIIIPCVIFLSRDNFIPSCIPNFNFPQRISHLCKTIEHL